MIRLLDGVVALRLQMCRVVEQILLSRIRSPIEEERLQVCLTVHGGVIVDRI